MPIVTVDMLAGRSAEQKALLAAGITEIVVESCGVDARDVTVILRESAADHWFVRGRSLAGGSGTTTSDPPSRQAKAEPP